MVATADDTVEPPSAALDDFVTPVGDYLPLVEAALFTSIESSDITDEFLRMATLWLEVVADLERDLRKVIGDDVFDDKLESRLQTRDAIQAGDLRRLLFTATA